MPARLPTLCRMRRNGRVIVAVLTAWLASTFSYLAVLSLVDAFADTDAPAAAALVWLLELVVAVGVGRVVWTSPGSAKAALGRGLTWTGAVITGVPLALLAIRLAGLARPSSAIGAELPGSGWSLIVPILLACTAIWGLFFLVLGARLSRRPAAPR